jgi:hypothetical protein
VGPRDIQFKPSAYDLDTNWFRVTFTTHLTPTALIQFPNISLAHQGFPNEMIPLAPPDKGDTTEVRRDETAHSIVLNPIILKKPTAAYAPTGVLPPPIAPEAYEKFISSPRGASQ